MAGFQYIDDYNPWTVGYPPKFKSWSENRWLAMTTGFDVRDPFCGYSKNFNIKPSTLLYAAQISPPTKVGYTVSDFTDWVYSLYRERKNLSALQTGKAAEKFVLTQKFKASIAKNFGAINPPQWSLLHNGMHSGLDDLADSKIISQLRINGRPLTGNPDLVYQNSNKQDLMIVEIKFTSKDIPKNLWPNVWAQLWAYSQIDEYKKHRSIVVIGEIWGPIGETVYLRKSILRNPKSASFDRFFCLLFDIYRTHCEEWM